MIFGKKKKLSREKELENFCVEKIEERITEMMEEEKEKEKMAEGLSITIKSLDNEPSLCLNKETHEYNPNPRDSFLYICKKCGSMIEIG